MKYIYIYIYIYDLLQGCHSGEISFRHTIPWTKTKFGRERAFSVLNLLSGTLSPRVPTNNWLSKDILNLTFACILVLFYTYFLIAFYRFLYCQAIPSHCRPVRDQTITNCTELTTMSYYICSVITLIVYIHALRIPTARNRQSRTAVKRPYDWINTHQPADKFNVRVL